MRLTRALLIKWHWRVGIAAAFFLVILAGTGIALNHARLLSLNHIYLEASWIMKAYNMDLPGDYIHEIQKTENGAQVKTADGTVTLNAEEAENIERSIARRYRGEGISLEKFLLDLHTGNIIGLPGKILLDLAGIAILFLSGTGLYNWWKRGKKKRK